MGKQKVKKDKTISPLQALTSVSPLTATEGRSRGSLGILPIGYYRGEARFWDLDKAVVQPLVQAEQLHILGVLDGREEDYDLQTLAIAAGEAIGTNHDASLEVPSGEVWYLNAVRGYVPATIACSIDYNWYCDLWADHAEVSPSGFGQSFYGAAQNNGIGGPWTYDAEFGWIQVLFAIANKEVMLRLPAGTKVRSRFTTRVAVGEAISCTFQLFGFIGKSLVT